MILIFKYFAKISKRIAEFLDDDEYFSIKKSIDDTAKKYNCHRSELIIKDMDYPEFLKW